MVAPPIFRTSSRPLGKFRTSSGSLKFFRSTFSIIHSIMHFLFLDVWDAGSFRVSNQVFDPQSAVSGY